MTVTMLHVSDLVTKMNQDSHLTNLMTNGTT
jgi:hypothetical protein